MTEEEFSDLIFRIQEVESEVQSTGSMTEEVRNAVNGVERSIAGAGGVIAHLNLLNSTLRQVKLILVALLILAVLILFKFI